VELNVLQLLSALLAALPQRVQLAAAFRAAAVFELHLAGGARTNRHRGLSAIVLGGVLLMGDCIDAALLTVGGLSTPRKNWST
jgi:hypothetical protein